MYRLGVPGQHLKMIQSLLLTTLLHFNIAEANSFPVRVIGTPSAVKTFTQLLNAEAPFLDVVRSRVINSEKNEYGIFLVHSLENQGLATRENRVRCALNYLLGDSLKSMNLFLVENDPAILISDGKSGVIDIADIERFNVGSDGDFTAFNVLLHELYEQYQLQVVGKLQIGNITGTQLKKAHQKAVQKESNFYSLSMLRTEADIGEEYIHIEFTNRIDFSRRHYYAYFQNGNIERIERKTSVRDF